MRLLLDESADARLIPYLRTQGHDVRAIAVDYPAGLADQHVLTIAHDEKRILITHDRDFGELVVAQRLPHSGVILLRLGGYASLPLKIERVALVLIRYSDRLDQLLVVTRDRVRVRHSQVVTNPSQEGA